MSVVAGVICLLVGAGLLFNALTVQTENAMHQIYVMVNICAAGIWITGGALLCKGNGRGRNDDGDQEK